MADANVNANPKGPDPFVPHAITTTTTAGGAAPQAPPLYPASGPDPAGTEPGTNAQLEQAADANPANGPGIEGEEVVWEARYSMKNFLGRITVRALLTVAWIALAVTTWGFHHGELEVLTYVLGAALLLFWIALGYRVAQAFYGHYYRLTNRRLFVSTGLMRRRRDQMELLRVKDVFTRQTLVERWLSLGTVVVVSNEKDLPVFYLSGVSDPKQVMDLIWNYARAERDLRSTNIHSV